MGPPALWMGDTGYSEISSFNIITGGQSETERQ